MENHELISTKLLLMFEEWSRILTNKVWDRSVTFLLLLFYLLFLKHGFNECIETIYQIFGWL